MIHEYSKANYAYMHTADRLRAIRFILAIPPGVFMHVLSLPDYVFTYIFEVGTIMDLPWLRFQDSDSGQRIRRVRTTENPMVAGTLCKESPLFKRIEFMQTVALLYCENIGLDKFENRLLGYAQRNAFTYKKMF